MENNLNEDKTIDLIREIESQVQDSLTGWKEDEGEGFSISASVKSPGVGQFGLISLTGKITRLHKWYNFWRTSHKYECYVRAVCMPLAFESTDVLDTLEAAKEHTIQNMSTQANCLIMTSKFMP